MNQDAIDLKRKIIRWVMNQINAQDYPYYLAKPGIEFEERAMLVDWRLTSLILQVNTPQPTGVTGHWLDATAAQDILEAEIAIPARRHVTSCEIAQWIDWEDDTPGNSPQGQRRGRGIGLGRWKTKSALQSYFHKTSKLDASDVPWLDGWRPEAVATTIMPAFTALNDAASIDRLMYLEQ